MQQGEIFACFSLQVVFLAHLKQSAVDLEDCVVGRRRRAITKVTIEKRKVRNEYVTNVSIFPENDNELR